jgi:cellulose synthase (UDP-forming)
MPRLSLQLPVHFTNHAGCTLRSFNYRFFSATGLHGDIAAGAIVTFHTKSNIEVILQHTGKTTANRREVLLSVENIDDIVERGLIDQLLSDLTHPHAESFTREG